MDVYKLFSLESVKQDLGSIPTVLCDLWGLRPVPSGPGFMSLPLSILLLLPTSHSHPLPFINAWQTAPFNLSLPNSHMGAVDSRLLQRTHPKCERVCKCVTLQLGMDVVSAQALVLLFLFHPPPFQYLKTPPPMFWCISWVVRFNYFILVWTSATI